MPFPAQSPATTFEAKSGVRRAFDASRRVLTSTVDPEIDQVCDVAWNKRSFSHLVVDNETKELIQALVNSQISPELGTDFIESKGNGLLILIHGVSFVFFLMSCP
jgi:hypothetical protein